MFVDGVLIGALLGIAEFVIIAIAGQIMSPRNRKIPAKKNKQLAPRPLLVSS